MVEIENGREILDFFRLEARVFSFAFTSLSRDLTRDLFFFALKVYSRPIERCDLGAFLPRGLHSRNGIHGAQHLLCRMLHT